MKNVKRDHEYDTGSFGMDGGEEELRRGELRVYTLYLENHKRWIDEPFYPSFVVFGMILVWSTTEEDRIGAGLLIEVTL